MALKYENLEAQARKRLWKDFLSKLNGGAGADVSEERYDALARYDINGRQIKNVVRTATALATSHKELIGYKHLIQVLDMMEQFDAT